jgi:hypothetical protein
MIHHNLKSTTALILALAFAAAPGAHARDVLVSLGRFNDGAVRVDFETRDDGHRIVALLGVDGNGAATSFSFDGAAWPKVLKLWLAARAIRADDYAMAGSLREMGGGSESVMAMAGGPGVRITVGDPTGSAYSFVVPRAAQDDFESKLRAIGQSATPPAGKPADSVTNVPK